MNLNNFLSFNENIKVSKDYKYLALIYKCDNINNIILWWNLSQLIINIGSDNLVFYKAANNPLSLIIDRYLFTVKYNKLKYNIFKLKA
jgi:hypothetical protein